MCATVKSHSAHNWWLGAKLKEMETSLSCSRGDASRAFSWLLLCARWPNAAEETGRARQCGRGETKLAGKPPGVPPV